MVRPPHTRTRKAEVDLRPGGGYILELVPTSENGRPFNIEGVYRRIDNPNELIFTLNYVGLPGQVGESLVTIRLRSIAGSRTEMLFKQEFAETPPNMASRSHAWEVMFERMGISLAESDYSNRRIDHD